jgi:UDP-glucose 4-epimerase
VISGDVRDADFVHAATKGMDVVYHLAACTVPPGGQLKPLMETNVSGTENVALASLAHGVKRLVFTSSAAVYGRRIANRHVTEETSLQPDSPYSVSKVRAEKILLRLHREQGLPVVISRTSNVFGPEAGDWREMFAVIAAGNFRLIGKGEGLRDLTDIDDFCEGLHLCATVPGVEGRIYNLVGNEPLSLYDWVSQISRETGASLKTPAIPGWPARFYNALNDVAFSISGRELPLADRLNLFLGDRAHDNSRAKTELGFAPRASAEEIVRKTVQGYRERGWLPPIASGGSQ